MSVLHGSWILHSDCDYFFVWGEVWRSSINLESTTDSEENFNYPFCLQQQQLLEFLKECNLKTESFLNSEIDLTSRWLTQSLTLPSYKNPKTQKYQAIFSENLSTESRPLELFTWQLSGFYLTASETINFLQALPLNTNNNFLGGELKFWSQVYRWILDLIVRRKFLPGITKTSTEKIQGNWQPLLDSTIDQARFAKFSQFMPDACLNYQLAGENLTSQELLLRFLASIIDAKLRDWIDYNPTATKNLTIQPYLRSLSGADSTLNIEIKNINRLENALYNWTLPIQEYLMTQDNKNLGQNQYRACFSLQSPKQTEPNKEQNNWELRYYLQALDNPEFIISAETIWQQSTEILSYQERTITKPQETLLKGLGLATRIYQPIADSLQTSTPEKCELNPIQVYELLRSIAWQLQDNGLGVILPPGLAPGENEQRLGVQITAEVSQKKGERLNLQSLLKYKLEISVGEQTVSKTDFEKLLAQKSPIVEINGQWLVLQPADVKAAQNILNQTNEAMNLSVEDALRLSTGDTKTLAKLPVVSFKATGVLEELINNLTDNKSVEPIEDIEGFVGELRPYQARGVGWLAFLEKWGLGACLADDMGLGKCISSESLVLVNGNLVAAEQIWNKYSENAEFDGEGYWSKPTDKLLVNSINETTGKIVQASLKKLYRQQVKEKLRKITLQDGSSLTITQKHKLLTNNSWTNDLKVGDYVCVPAKTAWNGQLEDLDLVEFIAWQIAEGYEPGDYGRLSIFQKDTNCLKRLLQIWLYLCKKYNFKSNQPKIKYVTSKTPCLQINSQAYRQLLEAKGYQWGKRSKEKSIPPFIMQADLASLRTFLSNYFDAEGAVITNMRSIEISTASPILIQQLSVLLRRFGIWLRIAAKQKRATNGSSIFRTYYIGTLGENSARRFLTAIGFNNQEKQQKLIEICNKISNTNVEGIPASEPVAEMVKITELPIREGLSPEFTSGACKPRHLGMHNTVYLNGSQQFSRDSLQKVVNSIDKILIGVTEQEYRQQKPSKWTLKTLEAYARLDKSQLEVTREKLEHLLDREVFYCPIKSIEEVDYEGWVYDFEVEKYHNFVANNIICHNTIQTIGFLLNLKQQEALIKPTLLICPTSVLNNWEREVKKFAPDLSTLIHHGDRRSKGKTFAKEIKNKQLVITSYSLVYRDLETFKTIDWEGIVLDEAQNIKNPSAKQSQAVRQLKAGFRIALTGTPVENRLSELWSILDFLNPNFLGTKTFFQKRFAIPIEKYGDRDSLKILRSLVQPFILRRLKTDREIIQDLPEKQEMNVFCGLSGEQAQLYQKIAEESLAQIESSEGIKRRGLILTLLLRLKQLCNHPELLTAKNTAINLTKNITEFGNRSGKLLRLEEMLEELIAEGDRALIFTQFSEWGKILKPYLETKLKGEVLFLYGATRRQQRQEMIDRFQNDPNGSQIFILSLKAGGTGLNLTRANHVFHVDRWWNPAVENQATDRAFRIGQKQNVQVHKFVCTGTLEERINDIIESKKELAEQTVDAGESWLTELDTNQLRNLLLLDRDSIIDEESD